MRVFVRSCVCALTVIALLPPAANGEPILHETTILDPLGEVTLSSQFTFDNDVALFYLVFGVGTFELSGVTTSAATGFDPILALFDSDGQRVPYLVPGGEEGELSQSNILSDFRDEDVTIPLFTLTGGTTYTLAVSQQGNSPHATLEDPFDASADEFRCFTIADPAVPCEPGAVGMFEFQAPIFSLVLNVTPTDTTPVPEPGTLSLLALGAAGAALARRRRARSEGR